MLNVSVFCIFCSYLVALCCAIGRLKVRNRWLSWGESLFCIAGFGAHTIYLLNRSASADLPPLLSSPHDWLLVLAWLLVAIDLAFLLGDRELPLGIVLLPLVTMLVAASSLLSTTFNQKWDTARGLAMVHASTLVLGTAAVSAGLMISLLYLWQNQRLKHQNLLSDGMTLPSLERLRRLNLWSLLLAVPLLSIGMGTGVALILRSSGKAWSDPVVIGGWVGWALMCVVLTWQLLSRNSPGRKMAYTTSWACGFLLLTFIGLQTIATATGVPSVHGEKKTGSETKSSGPMQQERSP